MLPDKFSFRLKITKLVYEAEKQDKHYLLRREGVPIATYLIGTAEQFVDGGRWILITE